MILDVSAVICYLYKKNSDELSPEERHLLRDWRTLEIALQGFNQSPCFDLLVLATRASLTAVVLAMMLSQYFIRTWSMKEQTVFLGAISTGMEHLLKEGQEERQIMHCVALDYFFILLCSRCVDQ